MYTACYKSGLRTPHLDVDIEVPFKVQEEDLFWLSFHTPVIKVPEYDATHLIVTYVAVHAPHICRRFSLSFTPVTSINYSKNIQLLYTVYVLCDGHKT